MNSNHICMLFSVVGHLPGLPSNNLRFSSFSSFGLGVVIHLTDSCPPFPRFENASLKSIAETMEDDVPKWVRHPIFKGLVVTSLILGALSPVFLKVGWRFLHVGTDCTRGDECFVAVGGFQFRHESSSALPVCRMCASWSGIRIQSSK